MVSCVACLGTLWALWADGECTAGHLCRSRVSDADHECVWALKTLQNRPQNPTASAIAIARQLGDPDTAVSVCANFFGALLLTILQFFRGAFLKMHSHIKLPEALLLEERAPSETRCERCCVPHRGRPERRCNCACRSVSLLRFDSELCVLAHLRIFTEERVTYSPRSRWIFSPILRRKNCIESRPRPPEIARNGNATVRDAVRLQVG